ncbi:MAG: hypothetical protein NXI26_26465 [bacterium]|nr:hypothetical protein [bacterium]
MADTYTYDIQQAGYAYDQADEKGELNFDQFVTEFREFPWLDQVGLNAYSGKSEPTISIVNQESKTSLWVSIAGDKRKSVWLVGYTYPTTKKGLFGLGAAKKVLWVEIYLVEQTDAVETYFKRYFEGERESLLASLKQHEKFDEMKSAKLL